MLRHITTLILVLFSCVGMAQKRTTLYEQNQTLTHDEVIEIYERLAEKSPYARLIEYGTTDAGRPLHLFVIDKSQSFDPGLLQKEKTIILVNNAIHPGEPCGVDASVKLAEEVLLTENGMENMDNVVMAIIPMYNIGGALNRGCCSRVNQNGPEMHGFRGNTKNLDLNRDFIKCDSENAKSFTEIYQIWMPDIFIDTHASNGADYQYTMTLINTQRNKLNPTLAHYLNKTMLPWLYEDMEKRGWGMAPYVHTIDRTPDNGIMDYLETPRYSTGYSTLYNAFGFVTETHMWKPYKDRVISTYEFLQSMIQFAEDNHRTIKIFRNKAMLQTQNQRRFDIAWELDTTKHTELVFKGYEAKTKKSNVTGGDRLYYDRNEPWARVIPYYNTYKATKKVMAPKFYIIPQGYTDVIERMRLNNITMQRLAKDVELEVELYRIDSFDTNKRPYESHYNHSNTYAHAEKAMVTYRKGDYVIAVNQVANRYIVETLEPEAMDSYFNWNFFDGILMQKEWFSAYIFEDLAEEILKENPALAAEVEELKKQDQYQQNPWLILYHIYKNSRYFEPTLMRYPVGRVMEATELPVE